MNKPLLDARSAKCRVRVHPEKVVIDGDKAGILEPRDFEDSFHNRNQGLHFIGPARLLSWSAGFGCMIAWCTVGTVEFRYVRTGLASGWFDLGGGSRR
jgi:hypothetical protein